MRAKNVPTLAEDFKCDKCYYLERLARGEYDCKKQETSHKCEISCNGKCLNHWNHSKADTEVGSWHCY